ncbi:MAG: hypothetical protein JWL59_1227 [Chthoniobacteraceae bacterium]|nr:hypothetical protein [Chthoniobacteraceae bacterium]
MSALKENKFLAGFLGVMVVATGGLGFLLYSASGRYSAAMSDFEDKSRQLYELQTKAPYPDEANLEKMKAQTKEHQDAVTTLQKSLLANQLPMESITPVQFQDKLKESVVRVTTRATEKGMKLPEKFYMGFDPYQFEPPKQEAASLLGKELKALELVVMTLIDSRTQALTTFDRAPLQEEGVDKARAANSKPDGKPGDKESAVKSLIIRRPVTLGFTGEQGAFRNLLNNLVSSKEQFFVPRKIDIKNEKLTGPSKATEADAAAAPAPFDPSASGGAVAPEPKKPALKYIVGEEKIDVTMQLDIVDFVEASVK